MKEMGMQAFMTWDRDLILSLRIAPMYRPIDSFGHIDCHFSSRKTS
jgi:hypothetical protein